MTQQTVYRLTKANSSQGLQTFQEPIPEIDKHELLIRISSVALNYRDVAIANGKYPFPVKENVVPCSDAMGEVAKVGSCAQGFEVGDKVVVAFDPTALYGTIDNWVNALGGPKDGVLAGYVNVSYQGAVKLPESSLSNAQWASLVCTGVTAWNAPFGNVPLKPGQTVLFQGTGGVSITGLVLAHAAGAKRIVTSSSDDKLELANKITNGRGVDFILENGGSGTIKQSIDAIAFGGVISVIGFLSQASQNEMPDMAGLALSKGCVVRGIIIGSRQQLGELVRFVGAKDLQMPVEKTFGFDREEVINALEYMSSGQHIGKVCITVT
ncbi:hypothetical protein LTR10_022394 [Elasticomyces elasticus]|uniref:Enoyl reductase (ER) domain-containing protein n=1 Tax=Exophiala sideris TaxID=1016849 RepID=A0ABR0IYG5_9EURO|nr:hypothetical protein LTR10_022394 [Elasticomyces elasticus]KAK5022617.1 hypothetical protein LTS07_009840 [Exophiala sideris]KAK5027719.1 hypothetical protein LTR13_009426 [Exophiala sideris]KAK5052193.1 hypothetical protein LTR69_009955 [Exophiala sideris]KAK5178010.1 hypothetical protein LTR44_009559 [Eurotiomycetes sp. CCFEE 6388]